MSRLINPAYKIYHNGIQQPAADKYYYDLTTFGGDGIASIFLTSDGLTKSGSNFFLFTSVLHGDGNTSSIQTDIERPSCNGFAYNSSTGLAQWAFMESKTTNVLIGGTVEGLEVEENGTAVTCYIEAII